MSPGINIKNKKAFYNFQLFDKIIAGMQLTGTEIKSIRTGKVSFVDSFCYFIKNELWVRGIHIAEYSFGSYYNHEPKRERKLLLNRRELNRFEKKTREKGLTIVPVRLFVNEQGFAKIEIALAKGKKLHDKREDIKRKDLKRELQRMV